MHYDYNSIMTYVKFCQVYVSFFMTADMSRIFVGSIVGVVLLVVVLVGALFFCWYKRRRHAPNTECEETRLLRSQSECIVWGKVFC